MGKHGLLFYGVGWGCHRYDCHQRDACGTQRRPCQTAQRREACAVAHTTARAASCVVIVTARQHFERKVSALRGGAPVSGKHQYSSPLARLAFHKVAGARWGRPPGRRMGRLLETSRWDLGPSTDLPMSRPHRVSAAMWWTRGRMHSGTTMGERSSSGSAIFGVATAPAGPRRWGGQSLGASGTMSGGGGDLPPATNRYRFPMALRRTVCYRAAGDTCMYGGAGPMATRQGRPQQCRRPCRALQVHTRRIRQGHSGH